MEEKVRKFKAMWHLECKLGEHARINSIFSGETLKVFEHDKNISCLVFQKGNHQITYNMDVRAVLITSCCVTNNPTGSAITQQPFIVLVGFLGQEFGQSRKDDLPLCCMMSGTSARLTQSAGAGTTLWCLYPGLG